MLFAIHETLQSLTGVYTEESRKGDQTLFVVEREAWLDLCSGLTRPCSCSVVGGSWIIEPNSILQVWLLAL